MHAPLFAALASEAASRASSLSLQHLCNIVCAWATLGLNTGSLLPALLPVVKDRARTQVRATSSCGDTVRCELH